MKTLTQYIKQDADLPALINGLELERWNVAQVVERASQHWQRELMQGQWYKDNRSNIGLMLETIETNKREAEDFLKGESAQ